MSKLKLKPGKAKTKNNLQAYVSSKIYQKVMKLVIKNNTTKSEILNQLIEYALENLDDNT